MHLVFFSHPSFLRHQSMPRFARMLTVGMAARGHVIEEWSPKPVFYKLPLPSNIRKWMGYIDQYIIFPFTIRKKLKHCKEDTLFVFTDHALGPWVPKVANRLHVIHCHDFLAQISAEGKIPENLTSASGKLYQRYIRNGYTKGKNFISVSEKTRQDLHYFLKCPAQISEVVYNGLNSAFKPGNIDAARAFLQSETDINFSQGFIMHVGGNQWYKNRKGVVEIYNAWRAKYKVKLPLLLIGEDPDDSLMEIYNNSSYQKDIIILPGKNDAFVRQAYIGADIFLFPSLAEGFGWPIAEAMASGCLVVTTDEAPMTEVAANSAFLIARKTLETADEEWAENAADVVQEAIQLTSEQREAISKSAFINVSRFDLENALNAIEKIYKNIVISHI